MTTITATDETFQNGVLIGSVTHDIDVTVPVNKAALRSKAPTALATNATFLALASPTTAQTLAQVKALTRQVDALIRLANGLLDTITDS